MTINTRIGGDGRAGASGRALMAAVEQKMEDQAEFVRWWDENVKKLGKRGKGKANEKK